MRKKGLGKTELHDRIEDECNGESEETKRKERDRRNRWREKGNMKIVKIKD